MHLHLFPVTATTKEPGTIKSSRRPRTVTLGRDSDELEIRHLSHPQARNFVVLSIPLKVVLTKHITSADGRVCFATDHGAHQHRSSETCLHTPMERGHKRFSRTTFWLRKLDYSSIALNILRGLSGVICCKSLVQIFHRLVVVINLRSGFGCALYALLAAGSCVIMLTTIPTIG